MLSDFLAEGLFDGDGNERHGLRFIGQFARLAAASGPRPLLGGGAGSNRADATRTAVDLEAVRAPTMGAELVYVPFISSAKDRHSAIAASASAREASNR